MKLIIVRSQEERRGVIFSLSCRVELSSRESSLVAKYGVERMAVARVEFEDMLLELGLTPASRAGAQSGPISIADLLRGKTFESDSIANLSKAEEAIRRGCKSLKDLLTAMQSYGGREEVEY